MGVAWGSEERIASELRRKKRHKHGIAHMRLACDQDVPALHPPIPIGPGSLLLGPKPPWLLPRRTEANGD